MVTFIRESSVIFQLYASPLTKPEMITNKSTSTLIDVKTLLTQADSFTPKDRSPECVGRKQSSDACCRIFKMPAQLYLCLSI